MTKKNWFWLAVGIAIIVLVLACGDGTNPQEGTSCTSEGQTVTHGGVTLTCEGKRDHLVWGRA